MSHRFPTTQDDSSILTRICDIVILCTLQLIVLFVPMFFLVQNEEIFEFNKMIFTYAGVIIIVTFWLIKSVIEKKFIIKKSPFDWFIVAFFISQLISTALSIHPRTSMFGYYTRFHGGLFSTISYFILFYATLTFVKKKHFVRFVGVILVGALLATSYAFPEHFGHSPSCLLLNSWKDENGFKPLSQIFNASCWIQDVQSRVFGTFGQPNWLAAYLIILLPLSISLIFFETNELNNDLKIKPLYLKILGGFLSFLMFATLLFTKSRSGFLGFAIGLSVYLVLLLIMQLRSKSTNNAKFLPLGIVVGLISFSAVLFGTSYTPAFSDLIAPKKEVAVTQTNQAPTDRLEQGGTDSGDIRRIVWKGAIDVWKRYPIFGSGVETFAYSYYRDRPIEHNNVSEWDFLYNKAHNEELNFLATTGIVGLATYIALQAVIGWFLFKEALCSSNKNTQIMSAAVLSGLIALHISNFFGFSTVMVSILMYVLPALVINHISDAQNLSWKVFSLKPAEIDPEWSVSKFVAFLKQLLFKFPSLNSSEKKMSAGSWMLVSAISVVGLYFLVQVGLIWYADKYYAQAKSAFLNSDYSEALTKLRTAIQFSPKEGLYYELYSKIASQYAIALLEQNENELGTQFANSALEASEASLRINPVHLNFYKSRNQVLVTLALAQPELYDSSIQTLRVARILSPTDPKLVYYTALTLNAQGKLDEAKKELRTSIEMRPKYDAPRYLLGQLLENEHDLLGAKEQYEYIIQKINPQNDQVQARLDAIATMSATKK